MIWRCVDCQSNMTEKAAEQRCPACGRVYTQTNGVWRACPSKLDALAVEEAEYHDHFEEDARAVHQLDSWRNRRYHELIWRKLRAINRGECLLEIGTGTGFDAAALRQDYSLVLTDISAATLERTLGTLGANGIEYASCTGEAVPFADSSFGGVFMVATLHHFHQPQTVVSEVYRVLRSGGRFVAGIEPNFFYFRLIKKFRTFLCAMTHMDSHSGSHADAEMEGFTARQLESLFPAPAWQHFELTPMWLLSGFMHYGLEFIFRSLHLHKRLSMPRFFERAVVWLDEQLFKVPGVRLLAWHWIITVTKV